MEKEDKIIKALLNEEFIEKAPDGFTDKVMQNIEASELLKQEQANKHDWLYGLVIIGSILLAVGIIFYIDSAFISRNYFLFTGYITGFFSQIATMFGPLSFSSTSMLSGSGLLIGIFIIMMVLLFFDGFVLRKRRYMSLFVYSF